MRFLTSIGVTLICGFTLPGWLLPDLASAQQVDTSKGQIQLVTPDVTKVVRLGSDERASLRADWSAQGATCLRGGIVCRRNRSGNVEVVAWPG